MRRTHSYCAGAYVCSTRCRESPEEVTRESYHRGKMRGRRLRVRVPKSNPRKGRISGLEGDYEINYVPIFVEHRFGFHDLKRTPLEVGDIFANGVMQLMLEFRFRQGRRKE